MNKTIYLDNAATSFPKPNRVYEAVHQAMREQSGNPGRSGHRLSLAAGQVVGQARALCARLFCAPSPDDIVFTNNTTTALNLALQGVLAPGDHVITGSLEHNAVSRPLYAMEKNRGIAVSKLSTDVSRGLSVAQVEAACKPNTKLLVCAHVSNVTGTVNPIEALGAFCRERGILFLVDGAQSAGVRPIDVQAMKIDMLAFPGHKGLLGPQGTGGLYVRPGLTLQPLIFGGTGNLSESLSQPEALPERLESGTLNTPGLAGLAAGVGFILEQGTEAITARERTLTERLLAGLSLLKGVQVFGPQAGYERGGVVSIGFAHTPPAEAMAMMDAAFGIAVRGGLHCSADAHRTLGTLERGGTLRISPGFFNTESDIDLCLTAVEACGAGR